MNWHQINWHKVGWQILAVSHFVRLFRKPVKIPPQVLTKLESRQAFFIQTLGRFIFDTTALGYLATAGEMWRSPETCELYAKEGKGIEHSIHEERCAVDLNFYFKSELISTFTEYAPLGQLWESYSNDKYKCRAGCFFRTRIDCDHFEVIDILP